MRHKIDCNGIECGGCMDTNPISIEELKEYLINSKNNFPTNQEGLDLISEIQSLKHRLSVCNNTCLRLADDLHQEHKVIAQDSLMNKIDKQEDEANDYD